MKKALFILIIIALLINTCSCAFVTELFTKKTVNDLVIEYCESYVDLWGYTEGRSFSVVNEGNGKYSVDINGKRTDVYAEINDEVITVENIAECNERDLTFFEYAKKTVIEYIDENDFFAYKEVLKEYINSIPIKSADFSTDHDVEFDKEYQAVLVNRKYSNLCGERMVYALLYGLMKKTQEVANVTETYDLLEKVIASIISIYAYDNYNYDNFCDLDCVSNKNFALNYTGYVYQYLGSGGYASIEACFYGYDEIQEFIPKDELDVYYICLHDVNTNENDREVVCNCINAWIIRAEERKK